MTKIRKHQDGLNLTVKDAVRLGRATESNNYHKVMSILEEFRSKVNWKTCDFEDNYIKWKDRYDKYPEDYWFNIKDIQRYLHNFICKHMLNKGKY